MKLTTNGMKPTKRQIAAAPPGRHYCGQGICLIVTARVTEHGIAKRRWIYRYTKPSTRRPTETTIGSAYAFSYEDVFAKATKFRMMVLNGQDPVDVKRAQRASTKTFGEASDQWFNLHTKWLESQRRHAVRALKTHGKALTSKLMTNIDADIIESAIKPLMDKAPDQARRTLRIWARMFDFAKHKKYYTGDNPSAWKGCMEFRFPDRPQPARHFTAMPYAQVPEFIRRLRIRQARSTIATALEFVILTACRSGEVLGAQWSEFDFQNRTWIIPAERMGKTKKEHRVPLCDPAMALLAHQREYSTSEQFVFTGYRRVKLDDTAMRALLRDMGVKVTVHGFRSSFRDWAGDCTDFHRENIEECLSHQVGSRVERAYRRRDAFDKRRKIMTAWADYIG